MDHQTYTTNVLSNGVKLVLVPMTGVNSIATSVMVGVGSRYETPEINGISHFLEHMVFKGTEKFPTTEDVNSIERIGGLQNAYTDVDITNYHNKVIASDWELALEINKELALHPRLEHQFVDKERNVILEEMKRYDDDPVSKVGETYHMMMYPNTSLGMRIIGTADSLSKIDSDALRTYHDRWYQPGNIVVVMAGKVNGNEQAIRDKVEQWFGKLHPRPMEQPAYITGDTQDKPHLTIATRSDIQQAHITLGFRSFRRGSMDRFAWSLFNLIMGVSFTSRLFREIREKQGLCYHIRSSNDNWKDVGYWTIYAGVATGSVHDAVKAILKEVSIAVEKGITDEELAVAKKRTKTLLAFKSEDPEFLGEFYGRQELFGQPVVTLEAYNGIIDAVSVADVNNLIRKYCVQNTLNMSLVWNKPSDETILPILTV